LSAASRACSEQHDTRTNGSSIHLSRPPADQIGKRVGEDVTKMLRECYKETAPVEFTLISTTKAARVDTSQCSAASCSVRRSPFLVVRCSGSVRRMNEVTLR